MICGACPWNETGNSFGAPWNGNVTFPGNRQPRVNTFQWGEWHMLTSCGDYPWRSGAACLYCGSCNTHTCTYTLNQYPHTPCRLTSCVEIGTETCGGCVVDGACQSNTGESYMHTVYSIRSAPPSDLLLFPSPLWCPSSSCSA